MAEILIFDTDAIGELTITLESAVDELGSRLDALERDAAHHGWIGAARESYLAAQREWSAALAQMRAILGEAVVITEGARLTFDEAERYARSLWS